jgi:hypothetical protein
MDREQDAGRLKVVDLDRGLFHIQYQSADDEALPPKVVISPAPDHERKVELLLHPDADQGTLWQPGSSLVVRTSSPAKLHVQVLPQRPNGSKAASVKFEPLTQGNAPSANRTASWDFETEPANVSGLRVLGHVAGIGDVVVGPNEWIAGPATPSRVEGIALEWPEKPEGLELRYAVKTAGQAGPTKMVELAGFAGTRGRALPLTGVVLELSGGAALNCQFLAEALFLSSPILRAIGQRVVLSGPTGREPLVGLRVSIQSIGTIKAPAPSRQMPATSEVDNTGSSPPKGKVRVFRSRPKPTPSE